MSEITENGISQNKPLPFPEFTENHDEPKITAPIRVCSLSEGLSRFEEISAAEPVGDDPEEIVRILLERNVLCFAAMQGKCWSSSQSKGNVLIKSDYIKSRKQMTELFYGTYTEDQAWRLFHPQQADGFGDLFQDGSGGVYFDMQHLRKHHEDSFASVTYAAITQADDSEITFDRYYESISAVSSPKPNSMTFKAVRKNGEWRLNTYITDAEAFDYDAPEYAKLKATGRKGSPELIEIAKKEVGNIGGEKYWSWYGFDHHVEWCAAFVSWCFAQDGRNGPYFLACNSEGKAWFESHGLWKPRGFDDIAPGDCIFFDWDVDGSADHVGLVIGTNGTNVFTIEGNRDDVCIAKSYPLSSPYILGYGLTGTE